MKDWLKRIVFGAVALITLFAGLYTGEYIYYICFGVLLAIALYAIVTNIWVLLDFNYLQTVTPGSVQKGEKAELKLQIHNDKPFIYPLIKVYYRTPMSCLTGDAEVGYLSILPFRHGEISSSFMCSLRGTYPLGIVRIEVSDMFGLFRFHMDLTKKAYHKLPVLTVYPRIIRLTNLPLPQIPLEGMQNTRLSKTDELSTVSDIRQYQYSDPMKKIHWKISSKLQELYVMNYEMTVQPHTFLFVETTPNTIPGIAKYQMEDQIVETATALIHYILSRWLPLKLVVYSNERHDIPGKDPKDFQAFYEYLSGMAFDSPFAMADIMKIESPSFHRQGSIILVVKKLEFVLFNSLCILKQTGVYPMVFLVQHREYCDDDQLNMVEELRMKDIPAFLIYTDQRVDEALEAIL